MLLAWKLELQKFAGGLSLEEIRSAALLGLIGFVIYPIMPDRFVDPWQLINPRAAWVIVIVIAGIGFANYVLLKLYGTHGIYLSGFLSGLVNSTAAAAELARPLGAGTTSPGVAVAALLLIIVAMFARNLFILAIFSPAAVATAAAPLMTMAAGCTDFGAPLAGTCGRQSDGHSTGVTGFDRPRAEFRHAVCHDPGDIDARRTPSRQVCISRREHPGRLGEQRQHHGRRCQHGCARTIAAWPGRNGCSARLPLQRSGQPADHPAPGAKSRTYPPPGHAYCRARSSRRGRPASSRISLAIKNIKPTFTMSSGCTAYALNHD